MSKPRVSHDTGPTHCTGFPEKDFANGIGPVVTIGQLASVDELTAQLLLENEELKAQVKEAESW